VNILPPEIANRVIAGSRSICEEAGIPLAGGHSIDSPEPIFGLAVNGIVAIENLKQNNTAKEGNLLFLTKPLGVGILTTAEKKGLLAESHTGLAAAQMMQLNKIGELLGREPAVTAITDVTGFGLLGHLTEMAEGSGLGADLYFSKIPSITNDLENYIDQKCVPGGTNRIWDSYGHKPGPMTAFQKALLADPQTSGGLLFAVEEEAVNSIQQLLQDNGLAEFIAPIGRMTARGKYLINVLD
jgi:selenide,water dikinase